MAIALGMVGSSAYAYDNYLEALGAKVPVSVVQDPGEDLNPMLNPGASRLVHDGNIKHQSNVPAPARPGQTVAGAPQTTTAPVQQGQPAAATPAQYAGNPSQVANVAPLPNPTVSPPLVDIPQEVLNRLAPANAVELRKIIQELVERQGAAVTPFNSSIQTKASQYVVDLSPGATPPVIRVATGVGATVNFVDAGGNPWPITFANNFHAEAATITQMAPHVLSVAANSPHLRGSVGVMLNGLTTPVNFIVTPAQDATDYRVDLLIPGMSPDAPPMVGAIQSRPDIAAGNLSDYLYGATPAGATRLEVKGVGTNDTTTRAWQDKNGNLVLRTSARVVSPGWYDMLPALDGTSVYQLPSSPVVRVSVNGKLETFNVQGLVPKTSLASSAK